MDAELGTRIAANVKQLREARGLSQEQMAKIAGLPRATWTHLVPFGYSITGLA
jgi:transcriptional regulator with XRE-family HTH domain